MAVTASDVRVADDASGDQLLTFTHSTSGGIVVAGATVIDTGSDFAMVGSAQPMPVSDNGGSITVDNAGTFSVQVTGSVTVDGSGVTQPVSVASLPLPSGAATAANQTTANASLATIGGAVSGSEMQVDIVSSIPAGTNNIGDVDIVSQPARSNTTDTIAASLDTASIMDGTTSLTPKYAAVNATTNGDNTLLSAVAGKKLRVLSYTLVADAAVGCAFEDGAGGTELAGQMAFAANGGVSVPFSPVGHFETTANTLLNLETDAAANVRGHIAYVEV